METIKRATINENAIKNFREQARFAAAKERVVHAALNEAASQVSRVYGPNFSLDASKDTLTEIRPDVFTGRVEAQLSVDTSSGLKRVAFPIEIRASEAILQDDMQAKADIEKSLADTKGDLEDKIAAYDKQADDRIQAAHAEVDNANKVAEVMENDGLDAVEAQFKVFNQKTAADAKQLNVIPGPGASASPDLGINSMPQAYIRIDKNNLTTFNVGDPLDLNGTPYVCVKVGDVYVEFQLQVL